MRKFQVLSVVILVLGFSSCKSAPVPDALIIGAAGVATAPQPGTLTVAAPLTNHTDVTVTDVKVDHLELASAALRTSLPIDLHTFIPGHSTAVVQADFDSSSLAGGNQYDLVVEGTYRAQRENKKEGPLEHFKLHTPVLVPPASPGSHTLGTTPGIPSNKTNGAPYPHQPPRMDNDTNHPLRSFPRRELVPGTPTPTGTQPAKGAYRRSSGDQL